MVVTYNQAHFIRETLDSILSQDYPHLEIVIADDASTDDTPRILEEYAARHPGRVKPILNQTNLGITGNCNVALSGCTGDLIAVMGGDDLFLPGKLSKQVAAFRDNPDAALCYHPVDIFESKSNKTIFVTDQHAREDIRSYQDIILKGGIAGASSVMIRPEAIPPADSTNACLGSATGSSISRLRCEAKSSRSMRSWGGIASMASVPAIALWNYCMNRFMR